MKNYFILALLLIICSLIISSCGGGDGDKVSQLSTLSTPTPTNPSQTGYIIIKVKWPQSNISENEVISSYEEEKDLIASMPSDAKLIYFDILDINGNPFSPSINAMILYPQNDEVKIDLIPCAKVIVRAKTYDTDSADPTLTSHLISIAEQKVEIKAGYNKVDLALGDYQISLTTATPGPSDNCDSVINTNLSIVYPTPTGTPAPAPSSHPVENRQINFAVESIKYIGTEPGITPKPEDIVMEPTQLPLDGTGAGKVKVTAKIKPIKTTIKATLDGTEVTNTCNLEIKDTTLLIFIPKGNLK
ncbi:MAG: hypothetical protein ABRQ39_22755 [Candidatus Eremiobacterota bacterium]